MTAANDVLEDETDNCPGHVVDGGRWWYVARSGEDGGEATCLFSVSECKQADRYILDVANDAVRPLEGDHPSNQGANRANEEEPEEATVHLTRGELTLRTNDTPLPDHLE